MNVEIISEYHEDTDEIEIKETLGKLSHKMFIQLNQMREAAIFKAMPSEDLARIYALVKTELYSRDAERGDKENG